MLTIAICDDEPLHRLRTAEIIQEKIGAYAPEVRLFAAPEELLRAVETEAYTPRIALLDIQMEEMDGITLARTLNRKLPQCSIIFLTSFLAMATEVYETEHVYFILKNQLEQRIIQAVERALTQTDREPTLLYRSGAVQHAVPCRDILYLERVLRRTRIKMAQAEDWAREEPSALLQGQLQTLFVRCHQSYWVNLRQIAALERAELVLSEGTRIPISRTYRDQAREQIYRFWAPPMP